MSTFDPHFDHPEQIKQEGEEVELSFDRVTATTGRVSWKIPPPADGCNADNQAYCGMVIVLNTVANNVSNRPADGTVYTADPTADADLHTGDKLGEALVVGAFYNDKTTTEFTITDLVDGAAYFITGHAVDCQNRYHAQGSSAYSLPLQLNEPTNDTAGFHEVELSNQGADILPDDETGLEFGNIYNFFVKINGVDYEIDIDGSDAQTYQELIDAINKQLLLLENPPQLPLPPATGTYYYNQSTGELFQWDGFQLVQLEVINNSSDPSGGGVSPGTYWLDSDSGLDELFRWNGAAWILQTPQLEVGYDVSNPPCDSYWYNDGPCDTYKWNGTTWCKAPTTFVQDTDPSDPESLACGSYWLNDDGELFCWETVGDCEQWVAVDAISYFQDPTTIGNGSFWFNDAENFLYERVAGLWQLDSDAFIQEDQPLTNIVGSTWYKPSTMQLFVLSPANVWEDTPVVIFDRDPTMPETCDLWFNTTTDQLFTWDIVNTEWDQVAQFFDQSEDPSQPKALEVDTIWYDNTNDVFYTWDGAQFVVIERTTVITWPSDPTLALVAGLIWLNTATNVYSEWDGTQWITLDPIVSPDDPFAIDPGTFWYNTSNDVLSQWNGTTWIAIAYVTTPPTPAEGAKWFDTGTHILYEWNGTTWVEATPLAVAELNATEPAANICSPASNIVITTTLPGTFGGVQIGEVTIPSTQIAYPSVQYNFKGDLFESLTATAILKIPVAGGDGLEDIPMYEQIGVGTDGSADERRELIDSIKKQLGYPTIEIELTRKQMDEAIQSALEELRLRSSAAYRRVYFFMDMEPRQQRYILTSKAAKMNTIVNIMGMWRVTSAFQSTAYAAGVYGQTVLQHLYHMGTFDLVSYHIISDYIEQLEQLFATRITYTWDESSRQLDVFQSFTRRERVLLDAVVERTEQELLTHRKTKNWIERWALAQAQLTLAQIRGKFASLPGAGGGVSLNAADLEALAQQNIQWCLDDIDNFIVEDLENLGIGSELIIG